MLRSKKTAIEKKLKFSWDFGKESNILWNLINLNNNLNKVEDNFQKNSDTFFYKILSTNEKKVKKFE